MTARLTRWAAPSVALLAVLASLTSLGNQFTYDDRFVIETNPVMKAIGQWWRVFGESYWPRHLSGDGYRPFTILLFQIEYALGGGRPLLFHVANVLLYVVSAVLVYHLARMVAREHQPDWMPWLVGALFAVHPVHVEAVANIVGQSELTVGIAVLAATILYLRDRYAGTLRGSTMTVIALLYAIACFAKEHGVVLPALLVAAELIIIRDPTSLGERVRRLRPFYLVLLLIAVAFVGARSVVLSDHDIGGFQPFLPFSLLQTSNGDRVLTAIGVVPEWLRLFYWPARLSPDYSPPMIEIAQGPSVSQLPGLMLLVGILALGVLVRRTRPVVSFGVAFIVITLLPSSNFLLPAGIVLAERTLFLPSVGAMLVAGDVVVVAGQWLQGRTRNRRALVRVAQAACAAVLIAATVRSAVRNPVWRDNDALFRQVVVDAPLSYRAHYMLGRWDFGLGRKREGEASFRRALSLFPYDPFLASDMAEQYRRVGLCKPAIPLFKWAFEVDSTFRQGRGALAACLAQEGEYAEARARALDAIRFGAPAALMRRVIVVTDSIQSASRVGPAPRSGRAGKVQDTVQKAVSNGSVRRGG